MILITGGARSGKSTFAEKTARELNKKTLFIATAVVTDEEMQLRVNRHKESRPSHWDTYEGYQDLGNIIRLRGNDYRYIILECMTTFVTNYMFQMSEDNFEKIEEEMVERKIMGEIEKIIQASQHVDAELLIITNEIGLGIVPDNKISRFFRDVLGRVNQKLAQHATHVYMMISGIPLEIK